jgi:hypothetical protein
LIPFKITIPSEEAFGNLTAGAKVRVGESRLSASVDEEKGTSRIVFSYGISAECYLTVCDGLEMASDAFSKGCEVLLKKQKDGGRYLTNTVKCVERINGSAVISPQIEGEYALQASLLPRAELVCRKSDKGMEAEGAVLAELLLCGADGTKRSATLSLPFVFPVDADGDSFEAEALVCGLNVRRKKSGETEAEATLKVSVRAYKERSWEYVSDVTEGEAYGEEESAFSVFLTNAGEELWEVAKRLNCSPEELQKSNPDLTFPLKAGERIYVYRQIKS